MSSYGKYTKCYWNIKWVLLLKREFISMKQTFNIEKTLNLKVQHNPN